MPEIDMQEGNTTGAIEANVAETKQQKFEKERFSRREALRKLGMTSSMALFAMFSVDQLANMVGNAMQQRAGDSKIADQVAQEFRQAGIAMASGPSTCIPDYDCTGCGGSLVTGNCCAGSSDPTACCGKAYGPEFGSGDTTACLQCCAHALSPSSTDYSKCTGQCYY